MRTIIAFFNVICTLFNCAFCVSLFCLLDELDFKPEKSQDLCETLRTYFPVELFIVLYLGSTAFYYKNWLQLLLLFPIILYNIRFYWQKRHKIYCGIGEIAKDKEILSFIYKIKFVYYTIVAVFNVIKFIFCATDMVSYKVWGNTNFFGNVISLIGFY